MKTYNEYVMVTDWKEVDAEDFYLNSDEWAEEVGADTIQQAKELQGNNQLFYAYVVAAVNYLIYWQMDAQQIFIDEDGDEIMSCGGEVIGNKHEDHFAYSY